MSKKRWDHNHKRFASGVIRLSSHTVTTKKIPAFCSFDSALAGRLLRWSRSWTLSGRTFDLCHLYALHTHIRSSPEKDSNGSASCMSSFVPIRGDMLPFGRMYSLHLAGRGRQTDQGTATLRCSMILSGTLRPADVYNRRPPGSLQTTPPHTDADAIYLFIQSFTHEAPPFISPPLPP